MKAESNKEVITFENVDLNYNELINLIKSMESNTVTDEQMKQLCIKSKSIILNEYEPLTLKKKTKKKW